MKIERFAFVNFVKLLTFTPRPLAPPTPHPIGQALDVGGANTVVSGIAGEDYFSSVLIV